MWGILNVLSTIVSIVGIYKIMKTMQQLKRNNQNLNTNYFQLTLHSLLLIINLIPVIAFCLQTKNFTNKQLNIFNIILNGTETIS